MDMKDFGAGNSAKVAMDTDVAPPTCTATAFLTSTQQVGPKSPEYFLCSDVRHFKAEDMSKSMVGMCAPNSCHDWERQDCGPDECHHWLGGCMEINSKCMN